MINSSNEYKESMSQRLRNPSYARIVLDISIPGIKNNCILTANNVLPWSSNEQILDDHIPSICYATLEKNRLKVNNTQKIPPYSNYEEQGIVFAEVSKNDCTFENNPILRADFTREYNVLGLTMLFDSIIKDYPSEFIIRGYKDNECIITRNVSNSTYDRIYDESIDDIDALEIEFIRTNLPNRRIRIFQLNFGLKFVKTNEDFINGIEYTEIVSPIATDIPQIEVNINLKNLNKTYNLDNPNGITKYLLEEQKIKLEVGHDINDDGNITWFDKAIVYLNEWKASAEEMAANFKAVSYIDFMTEDYFKGTYLVSGNNMKALVDELLIDENLPPKDDGTSPWKVDETLQSIITKMPIPIMSKRELLQYIANASCCMFRVGTDGDILIEKNPIDNTGYYLDLSTASNKPEVELDNKLRNVIVKVNNISVENEVSEIFKGDFAKNDEFTEKIEYNNMATEVSATVTGGTLISAQYYANACILTINGTGNVNVVINGKKINVTESEYIKNYNSLGKDCIISNPFITDDERAEAVATFVGDYLNQRNIYEVNYRGEPTLECVDKIQFQTAFTNKMNAQIIEQKLMIGNGMSGSFKLRGGDIVVE